MQHGYRWLDIDVDRNKGTGIQRPTGYQGNGNGEMEVQAGCNR